MNALRCWGAVGCGLLAAVILGGAAGALRAQESEHQKDPVPPAEAQNKALALVREVFKKEYDEAKTPDDRKRLAADLLKRGIDSEDVTEQFVLLRVARDVALGANHPDLACQAIDELADRYQVDRVAMKQEVLAKALERSTQASEHKSVADLAAAAADEAVARDDYQAASGLLNLAISAARKLRDTGLVTRLVARAAQVDQVAKGRAEIADALATLEKDPIDPKANLKAGQYYCLVRGDWDKGLPMLALAGDGVLDALAKKELLGPKTAQEQVALGDGWWDLSAEDEGTAQGQLAARAAHWYKLALPQLSGLTQTRVQRRVDAIESAGEEEPKPGETGSKVARAKKRPGFDGLWQDRFNNILELKIDGDKVTGTYKNYRTSRFGGYTYVSYEGRIEGKLSRDGRTLTGQWARSPTYQPPSDAGSLLFKLFRDGTAFAGTFSFGAGGAPTPWTGMRITPEAKAAMEAAAARAPPDPGSFFRGRARGLNGQNGQDGSG